MTFRNIVLPSANSPRLFPEGPRASCPICRTAYLLSWPSCAAASGFGRDCCVFLGVRERMDLGAPLQLTCGGVHGEGCLSLECPAGCLGHSTFFCVCVSHIGPWGNLPGQHLESGSPGHRKVAIVSTIRVPSNRLQQCPHPGPGMGGVKPQWAPWHVALTRMSGSPPPLLFFLFAFFLLN